jgi:hypothetical protein
MSESKTQPCRWCGEPIERLSPQRWGHRTGWAHVTDEALATHYAEPVNPNPAPGPPKPPPLKHTPHA